MKRCTVLLGYQKANPNMLHFHLNSVFRIAPWSHIYCSKISHPLYCTHNRAQEQTFDECNRKVDTWPIYRWNSLSLLGAHNRACLTGCECECANYKAKGKDRRKGSIFVRRESPGQLQFCMLFLWTKRWSLQHLNYFAPWGYPSPSQLLIDAAGFC